MIACAPIHIHTHLNRHAIRTHISITHSLTHFLLMRYMFHTHTQFFYIFIPISFKIYRSVRYFIVMVYVRRCLGYLCSYIPACACFVVVVVFFSSRFSKSMILDLYILLSPQFLFSLLLLLCCCYWRRRTHHYFNFLCVFSLSLDLYFSNNNKTRNYIHIWSLKWNKNMREQVICMRIWMSVCVCVAVRIVCMCCVLWAIAAQQRE